MSEKHKSLNPNEGRERDPLYTYGAFDPRLVPEAQAANEAISQKEKFTELR